MDESTITDKVSKARELIDELNGIFSELATPGVKVDVGSTICSRFGDRADQVFLSVKFLRVL